MAIQRAKFEDVERPVEKATAAPSRTAGRGLGLYLLNLIFSTLGTLTGKMQSKTRSKSEMKAVDLNQLVTPYLGTGLYLAVTPDNTSVIATGQTMREAIKQAAERGYAEPVIMRAPSREAVEDGLHL